MASVSPKPFPRVAFWRDPDINGLEIRSATYDVVCFPKHTHEGYSIGFVESGETTAFLRGRTDRVEVEDIVLIHPEEVHACNPRTGSGWAHRMFYLSEDLMRDAAEAMEAAYPTQPGFASPVVQDHVLLRLLRGLHLSLADKKLAPEKEGLLLDCLAHAFERYAGLRPKASGIASGKHIRTIKDWLRAHVAAKVSLAELAQATGLSRYAVLRSFRRATGLTPHAFQSQLRIGRAKHLLAGGAPIAQVALDTGFSDQSHFSNTFRRITGATPRQYQAAL